MPIKMLEGVTIVFVQSFWEYIVLQFFAVGIVMMVLSVCCCATMRCLSSKCCYGEMIDEINEAGRLERAEAAKKRCDNKRDPKVKLHKDKKPTTVVFVGDDSGNVKLVQDSGAGSGDRGNVSVTLTPV